MWSQPCSDTATAACRKKTHLYEKAIEVTQGIEAAEKNAKIRKQGGIYYSTARADRAKQEKNSFTPTCYRCGDPHYATECKHKSSTCNFCHKKGHLDTVCKARRKASQKPMPHRCNFYVARMSMRTMHMECSLCVQHQGNQSSWMSVSTTFPSRWNSTQGHPCLFSARQHITPSLRGPQHPPWSPMSASKLTRVKQSRCWEQCKVC